MRSPRRRRARATSLGWIVTRLAWMAAKLVSSKSETRYASADSCSAMTADDWKRRSVLKSEEDVSKGTWRRTNARVLTLGNFTYESLERKLADEQLGRLLVASDFTQGDGTRAVAVRLLDTTGGGRRFAGCLGGELLAWRLASGRLSGGLLGASHVDV